MEIFNNSIRRGRDLSLGQDLEATRRSL